MKLQSFHHNFELPNLMLVLLPLHAKCYYKVERVMILKREFWHKKESSWIQFNQIKLLQIENVDTKSNQRYSFWLKKNCVFFFFLIFVKNLDSLLEVSRQLKIIAVRQVPQLRHIHIEIFIWKIHDNVT